MHLADPIQLTHSSNEFVTALREIELFKNGNRCRHIVITGTAGIGKTRMLTDLATAEPELVRRIELSSFAFTSYDDWIRTLAECLGIETTMEMSRNELEDRIEHPTCNDRRIIVFEDFDRLLIIIGMDGQRLLWNFLDRTPHLLLVASAQTPIHETIHNKRLVARFLTIQLPEMTVSASIQRFQTRETVNQTETLNSHRRHKVAALHQLIGGLPRHWTLLEQLDASNMSIGIGTTFTKFLESLTPLFRSELEALAPAKAKLLVTLCTSRRGAPHNVTELANMTGGSNQTTAKMLGYLEAIGHVRTVQIPGLDRRLTYYEATNRLLVMSPICTPPSHAKNLAQIIEYWNSTTHNSASQILRIDLTKNSSGQTPLEQTLIDEFSSEILKVHHLSTVDVINTAAQFRNRTNPLHTIIGKIGVTLRNNTRALVQEWSGQSWDNQCNRDLAMIHAEGRAEMVAAMFNAATLDPSWIQIAINQGYEPNIAGILCGYTEQPAMLKLACTLITHVISDEQRRPVAQIAKAISSNQPETGIALLPTKLRQLAQQIL
jgi:hypothetical protein